MSDLIGREIPLAIAVAAIVLMIGDYVLLPLEPIAMTIRNWTVIVAAFGMIVGMVSMTIYHLRVIMRRESDWYYSVFTLIACYAFFIFALIPPILTSTQFNFMYKWINSVSARTTYGALAFWISAAALRTLKAKSFESTLLVVAAMICMFANAPVSVMVGPFKPVAAWLLDVPSTGAYRGIIITSACGVVALGLRILIGRERPWE